MQRGQPLMNAAQDEEQIDGLRAIGMMLVFFIDEGAVEVLPIPVGIDEQALAAIGRRLRQRGIELG